MYSHKARTPKDYLSGSLSVAISIPSHQRNMNMKKLKPLIFFFRFPFWQLKARFGGIYLLTMTTSPETEQEVENLVRGLSPSANKIYHLSGTLKFELPKQEVRIADVFASVENFKRRVAVQAWGLSDATMEDVFIKVAKGAGSFDEFP